MKKFVGVGVRLALAGSAVTAMMVAAAPGIGHAAGPVYYLSLGDSYSVGYMPNPSTGGFGGASAGYTDLVAANKGLQLENFGCGGATSASLLNFAQQFCGVTDATNNPHNYGPAAVDDAGPVAAGQSQVQAAVAFIAANPNAIGMITVSIGGNDVTPCAAASASNPVNGQTDPVSCVLAGVAVIKTNVETAVSDLHNALVAADGTKGAKQVPIVGLTYPDVLLGLYVNTGPAGTPPDTPTATASAGNIMLAKESVTAFALPGAGINATLKTAYASVHGKFIDVTKATHAYTPLTKTTKMDIPALGIGSVTVPKAVADVCALTYYCQFANIHPQPAGYAEIAKLIEKGVKVKV